MPSLKDVRNRINSVKSTQQITKAMKMVAAAKLRKAQDGIMKLRPYAQMLQKVYQNVSSGVSVEELGSEYLQVRTSEKVLVVSITSDRGLCGAFNANVMKGTMQLVSERYTDNATQSVTYLPVGNKGADFLRRRKLSTNTNFVTILQKLNFTAVKGLADFLLNLYKTKQVDRVELVYNEFKNVALQQVVYKTLLPLQMDETTVQSDTANNYIFEPTQEEIIAELIPKTVTIQLYKAILESNAGEQGARMTAMDKATDNAESLVKELILVYNKTRQAAITKEILEIVGGAEALKAE
jgi:F-type H+-transporting ATPase subunit gamma